MERPVAHDRWASGTSTPAGSAGGARWRGRRARASSPSSRRLRAATASPVGGPRTVAGRPAPPGCCASAGLPGAVPGPHVGVVTIDGDRHGRGDGRAVALVGGEQGGAALSERFEGGHLALRDEARRRRCGSLPHMDLELDGTPGPGTGGSRGIGLAVGRALAAEGADVALVARGEDALRAAAEDVARASGRTVDRRAGRHRRRRLGGGDGRRRSSTSSAASTSSSTPPRRPRPARRSATRPRGARSTSRSAATCAARAPSRR